MKIVIYDQSPNTYLATYYYQPLFSYLKDLGRDVELVDKNLTSISNSKLIIDVANLGNTYPVSDNALIDILKNNGNELYCFDINDHSSLGFSDVDISKIDFLFKIAGIQESDYCNDLLIDNDLTYRLESKAFYPIDSINYNNYKKLKNDKKIMSVPYIMNDIDENPGVGYEGRIKKCLVRGGTHFKRVHLFFNLLQKDLADENSAFNIKGYQHMMCEACKNRTYNNKDYTYNEYKTINNFDSCVNPAVKWWHNPPNVNWDGEVNDQIFNKSRWAWNNRCFPQYYWLMDKFTARYGHLDSGKVSQVLNSPSIGSREFNGILGRYMFYGDFKWIFSIYAPQRFWHAARCKNINLLPERAAAQSYFPEMTENNHFICFKEDFSDLEKIKNVSKEQYEHITNNCWDLYQKYMKFGKYKLSENLMNEIIKRIEG